MIELMRSFESNRMMSDDTEIDEEIERQLEADAHDRDYLEQPLIDDKKLDFLNDNNINYFPLTKQLSLPPNFTFHSMSSITECPEKGLSYIYYNNKLNT
ncbi:unnamed protein product [Rotaria sp. Silwood1]|nr:unnamed protein product [Rotaria sp. Silwood1]